MMPATSATGVMPACSQPRSLGLTCSSAVSTRCSRASRRLGSVPGVGWGLSNTPEGNLRKRRFTAPGRRGVGGGGRHGSSVGRAVRDPAAPAIRTAGGRTRRMWLSEPLYAAYARRLTRQLDASSSAAPRRGHARRKPPLGQGPRAPGRARGTRPGPTTSRTCCRLVRRGRTSRWSPCGCCRPTTSTAPRRNSAAAEDHRRAVVAQEATQRWRIKTVGASTCAADRGAAQGRRGRGSRCVDQMLVNVAVGYGGREEITDAVRRMLAEQRQPGRSRSRGSPR